MASRPHCMTVPNSGALTVLIVPFKKERGQSSISTVACILRECFPGIDWRLRKAASGQPLDVSGQWQLSVSHSAGYLAVSLSKPTCGIDVEVLRHSHCWRELYDWITPPFARLREPTSTDFLRAWTMKEALLKWQCLGLDGGLQRQPVPEQDWPGWQLLTIDDRSTFVRHERLRSGMSLALVCEQALPVHWLISPTFLSPESGHGGDTPARNWPAPDVPAAHMAEFALSPCAYMDMFRSSSRIGEDPQTNMLYTKTQKTRALPMTRARGEAISLEDTTITTGLPVAHDAHSCAAQIAAQETALTTAEAGLAAGSNGR